MASPLIWVLTVSLFALGLAGVFVPALPGVALVFGGVLLYAAATEFSSLSVGLVIGLGAVAVLAWLVEYAGAIVGGRMGGGGRYTMIGIVAGAVVGLLAGGPFGLVIGVVAGALLGALYEGKTAEQAQRAALFSVLGIVGAKAVQLFLALGMIVAFVIGLLV